MIRFHLINKLLHVDKPRLLHLRFPQRHVVEALAELVGRFVDLGRQELTVLRLLGRVVIGEPVRVRAVEFKVSARLEVLECLGEELVFVGDAALQLPAVDEVELAAVYPVGFEVVDFEDAVGWDPTHISRSIS